MITVSLCMIVRDEEDVLPRCLKIMKDIADEIIIVDTGSVDKTKEIARQYTSDIYDFEWIDDFAAARNFSFSKASMDYIFWLDADDVLLEEDVSKFKKLKETLSNEIDGVMMKYNTGFDEKGNVLISCYRQRLIKRENNQKWQEPVHEYLTLKGNILESDINVYHSKVKNNSLERNIKIFEEQIKNNKELSSRGMYYYSRELYFAKRVSEARELFQKFLGTEDTWVEDKINACLLLSQCCYEMGDNEGRCMALFKSFMYDIPRAEICCELGKYFINKEQYSQAVYWLKYALQLKKPENKWGFILHDYFSFIPYIHLCVCYDKLGDYEEANRCNEKAAEYSPDNPHVLHNRKYFESKLNMSK